MIPFSETARLQVRGLQEYYVRERRVAALRNLHDALENAVARIEDAPQDGLPAPRPYPQLRELGMRWTKCGRYWIAYRNEPLTITFVFFETDDIPNRV